MENLQAILLFAVGLLLLIKAGDWFVDGATGLARRFHIPDILIGATVVSIGTTLPEVMVSATSAVSGHGELAYGNAIGSIICNTALIAAITIAVKPGQVDRGTMKTPVLFYFIAAVYYTATAYLKGHFTRADGILLLMIFAIYMTLAVMQAIRDQQLQEKLSEGADPHDIREDELEDTFLPLWKDLLLLVIGAALIAVGANLLVDNGTILARVMGVPESVIALTFIALGTSLPELVTAVTSLAKGHGALSLGNIIGANMFNLVLVSGLSITLNPFDLPTEKLLAGHNASLVVDVPLDLHRDAPADPAGTRQRQALPLAGHPAAGNLRGLLYVPVPAVETAGSAAAQYRQKGRTRANSKMRIPQICDIIALPFGLQRPLGLCALVNRREYTRSACRKAAGSADARQKSIPTEETI